jgi:hypothetical protein
MATRYSLTSPYHSTITSENFLDIMENRPIPKLATDAQMIINKTYAYRPDLLAFDIYDDASLWWVFAQRNPNTISDPIWGFAEGVRIYLPTMETLQTSLGI